MAQNSQSINTNILTKETIFYINASEAATTFPDKISTMI